MLIVTSGTNCFTAPKYHNQIFGVVTGMNTKASFNENTLQHFGYEDSIINHLLLIKDIENHEWNDFDLDKRTQTSMLSKRFFTVQCIKSTESLSLNWPDIDIMKRDFKGAARQFIKIQIAQTQILLSAMMTMVRNFDKKKNILTDYFMPEDTENENMLRRNQLAAKDYLKD
jgi:hypothetical protein